jgi:hypothetical protein
MMKKKRMIIAIIRLNSRYNVYEQEITSKQYCGIVNREYALNKKEERTGGRA